MPIKIRINQQQLNDVYSSLKYIQNGASKAISRAINKTLTGVNTDAAKIVTQDLNVTQKIFKKRVSKIKAKFNNISGKWQSKGSKGLPLSEFTGTRPVRSGGVSVKIFKGTSRKIIRDAFMARMPNRSKTDADAPGHMGVFWRGGKGSPNIHVGEGKPIGNTATYLNFPGRWPKIYRLPISERFGPTPEDVLKKKMPDLEQKAQARIGANLDHEVEYLLKQNQPSGDE